MKRAKPAWNGLWAARLTFVGDAATDPAMKERTIGSAKSAIAHRAMLSVALVAPLAGCINVNAPSEPIVIELNINIKQEVLYRLVDSAEQNIEDNPEIF